LVVWDSRRSHIVWRRLYFIHHIKITTRKALINIDVQMLTIFLFGFFFNWFWNLNYRILFQLTSSLTFILFCYSLFINRFYRPLGILFLYWVLFIHYQFFLYKVRVIIFGLKIVLSQNTFLAINFCGHAFVVSCSMCFFCFFCRYVCFYWYLEIIRQKLEIFITYLLFFNIIILRWHCWNCTFWKNSLLLYFNLNWHRNLSIRLHMWILAILRRNSVVISANS